MSGHNDIFIAICTRGGPPVPKHTTPKSSGASWWTQAEGGPAFTALAEAERPRLTQVSSVPMPDGPNAWERRS